MVVHVIDFSVVQTKNPLNPLGAALRSYIANELQSAIANAEVTSIVLTGGGAHFSAGADLTEFENFGSADNSSPMLTQVVQQLEDSPKPVVAAISGTCLGGGLEVALACHYRICDQTAKLGLPEVLVGVIPGAHGTQRLPRLIGLQAALQCILTGQTVTAKKALSLGIVDAVVDKQNLLTEAKKWAEWAELMPLDDRRVGQMPIRESPAMAHVMLQTAQLSLPKLGSEGAEAALEAVSAACRLPLEQGVQVEADLFLHVLNSAQGQARRHGFFAVRQAQKMIQPAPQHVLLSNNKRQPVPVAVIGAGTMGSGIALVLLQTGFQVTLVDVSEPALKRGMQFLHRTLESYVKRRKVTSEQAAQLQANLASTQNLDDLSSCMLVVEAVIEKMSVKQHIFGTLNRVCPQDAILLSNTSTLDLDEMASVLDPSRRSSFAGWHFFSPAHVMKLVEIVRSATTSSETVALLQVLTKCIGKIGVVVGNCDGFVGNRMLKPYSAETALLLAEGAGTIADVDAAFVEFGMALGPFQMSDLAGNDVGYNIRRERGWVRDDSSSSPPPNRPARYTELADDMITKLHRLGQKVGKGWYDYDPAIGKGRKPLESPEMDEFVKSYVTINPKHLSMAEILERVLYPLVNEGFKILEEGIARQPSDIDVIYLYGYGWPAWRGGPMYWADHDVGLPMLLRKLQEFARQFPDTEHYQPSALLKRCVNLGVTTEEYYRRGLQQPVSSKL